MRQLKITKSITNRESASLDKYLQEIGKEELITVEEEVELAAYSGKLETYLPALQTFPGGKKAFLTEVLCSGKADIRFREFARSGELQAIFPEIQAMIGVGQPPEFHPEGDVFEHGDIRQ